MRRVAVTNCLEYGLLVRVMRFSIPGFRRFVFCLGDEHSKLAKMPIRNDDPIHVWIEGEIDQRDVALAVGSAYAQPIDPSDTGYVWHDLWELTNCVNASDSQVGFSTNKTAGGNSAKNGRYTFF